MIRTTFKICKIDNLHAYYDGNQLQRVEDNAIKLLYNGSMDFKDSGDSEVEYTYNDNGALTSDKNRGIALIEYDNSNNPKRVQFTNGNVTEYIYTATGQKLRTIHYTATSNITVPMGTTHTLTQNETQSIDSTDYLLGGTYRLTNGMRSMYLFPGGYCNLNDPTVTNTGNPGTDSISYHYYNKDHLGNNREVISESGQVEQVVHYYPFGTPFTDGSSTNIGLQPYLYGNKELDMMHGLNTYDFGARNYNPLLPMWDRVDRYCEKYYDINPYSHCYNNPLKIIDENGDTVTVIFDKSHKRLEILDMDYYNPNKPLKQVSFEQYKQGEYNQVLVVDNVFSGGHIGEDGVSVEITNKKEVPIPDGIYEILDDTPNTKHPDFYRLDSWDIIRHNDRVDYYGRKGLRLHPGTISHGCVTINNIQENSDKIWSTIRDIFTNTKTGEVKDVRGLQFLNPKSKRTFYGIMIVK